MAPDKLTCSNCGKRFTKVSSRNRHARQCLQGLKPPPRRKACRTCSSAKLRCGLEKPSCQRCLSRSIECTYEFLPSSSVQIEPAVHTVQSSDSNQDNFEISDAPALPQYWPTPESSSHAENSTHNNNSTHDARQPPSSHVILPSQTSTAITSLPDSSIPKIYGHDGTAFRSATGGPFANGVISKQCAHTMVRTMKSWSRLMSEYNTPPDKRLLPPIIHIQQQTDFVRGNGQLPTALANCVALTKMWAGHDVGLGELVDSTIRGEVRRLLNGKDTYTDELELLAAGQSLVLLLVVLLFGIKRDLASSSNTPEASETRNSANAKLVIDVWDVREMLMKTSFAQSQDGVKIRRGDNTASSPHVVVTAGTAASVALTPSSSVSSSSSRSQGRGNSADSMSWRDWAIAAATRRTIIALHNLELAWACLHGYPVMSCFGLYHLPLPEAGYLWRATSESEWRRLYAEWRRKWYGDEIMRGIGDNGDREDGWSTEPRKTGPYVLTEYVNIKPGEPLNDRAEQWLAEADEFGVMLMSVVSAVYDT